MFPISTLCMHVIIIDGETTHCMSVSSKQLFFGSIVQKSILQDKGFISVGQSVATGTALSCKLELKQGDVLMQHTV